MFVNILFISMSHAILGYPQRKYVPNIACHLHLKKIFIVYLKFKLNWALYNLPGNASHTPYFTYRILTNLFLNPPPHLTSRTLLHLSSCQWLLFNLVLECRGSTGFGLQATSCLVLCLLPSQSVCSSIPRSSSCRTYGWSCSELQSWVTSIFL